MLFIYIYCFIKQVYNIIFSMYSIHCIPVLQKYDLSLENQVDKLIFFCEG